MVYYRWSSIMREKIRGGICVSQIHNLTCFFLFTWAEMSCSNLILWFICPWTTYPYTLKNNNEQEPPPTFTCAHAKTGNPKQNACQLAIIEIWNQLKMFRIIQMRFIMGFWLTLAVLCPRKNRLSHISKMANKSAFFCRYFKETTI